MSYISTNHRGGIGNVLFKLAASISTAIDNKVEYLFSNEFIRDKDLAMVTKGFPDYRIYYPTMLRNVSFLDKLPAPYITYTEPNFHYDAIPYTGETDLLLDGGFQSEKYFENNREKIIELFKIPNFLEEHIKKTLPSVSEYVSLHVRRGDYVWQPQYYTLTTKEFYQKAVEELGKDRMYLIFSDDLEGCKELLDFIPNKVFYETGEDWMDFYIMSICGDNIIANSSFSWWAAYLNQNINKKVIAPINWFGPAYAHFDTKDLIPKNWIKI
jgi:hypothetical protein